MVNSEKTTRPTFVEKDIYIKFGNLCRSNGREIGDVLNSLLNLYISNGERLFSK